MTGAGRVRVSKIWHTQQHQRLSKEKSACHPTDSAAYGRTAIYPSSGAHRYMS
jgi:hypothetical protein